MTQSPNLPMRPFRDTIARVDIDSATMAQRLGISLAYLRQHIYVTKKLAQFGRLINPRLRVFDEAEEAPMRAILDSLPKSRRNPALRAKQQKALTLKAQGLTNQRIADELGYADSSGASRAIKAAKKQAAPKKRRAK